MKFSLYVFLLICCIFSSCKLMHPDRSIRDNRQFGKVLNDFYDDQMKYFPLLATQNGDNRYNDQLPVDFTDSYFDTLRNFYGRYLEKILVFDRDKLNRNDQISYDVFVREMKINIEGIDLHLSLNPITMPNIQYMPFNQFEGIPLFLGQMGSGGGVQPFHTVADYEHWISRANKFQAWSDSAIVYFKKGLQNGYILPRCLVEKMIPEMQNMVVTDITQSIFYTPLTLMPASFSDTDKQRNPFRSVQYRSLQFSHLHIKNWLTSCKTNTCLKAVTALGLMHYRTAGKSMIFLFGTGLPQIKLRKRFIKPEFQRLKGSGVKWK